MISIHSFFVMEILPLHSKIRREKTAGYDMGDRFCSPCLIACCSFGVNRTGCFILDLKASLG